MLRVSRIEAGQGAVLKTVRCEALRESPSAFMTTLAEAQKRSDAEWEEVAETLSSASGSATFLAFHDEKPCGMMSCYSNSAHPEILDLAQVWTAPEVRRLKVGYTLWQATLNWAKTTDATRILAWVAEQNAGALDFYRALNFVETTQREPIRAGADEQIRLFIFDL